jgi:hypothetical protein
MNLSRAMSVAADGLAVEKEQLRNLAQTLGSEERSPPKRPRPAASAANMEREAQWREESILALQASRRLLARTIDMLT